MSTALDLLPHFRLPTRPRVFVLGCFERRVSLYSQQQRAINLVTALERISLLSPNSKVAVVGAGAAGLTAALAFAIKDHPVLLLERAAMPLAALTGNHTRSIHPNILDWPRPSWSDATTALPFLNWTAAVAGSVATQLLDGWNSHPARQRVTLLTSVTDVRLAESNINEVMLSWNSGGYRTERFGALVLAVGFGRERNLDDLGAPAYWENDSLHQVAPNPDPPTRWLVSGLGDGGATDALRLSLGPNLDSLLGALLSPSTTGRLRDALLNIEQSVLAGTVDPARLWDSYASLPETEIDHSIRGLIRADTQVWLNARSAFPLNPDAAILHRYLLSRLLRAGLRYLPGELALTREGRLFRVRGSAYDDFLVDRVIARHGPAPELERSFTALWAEATPLRSLALRDDTRRPIWSVSEFSPASLPDARSPLIEYDFVKAVGVAPSLFAEPSPAFHFFIVSGLSACGKDSLVQSAIALGGGYGLEVLTKFSTRPARMAEPPYFQHLPEREYRQYERQGRLFCPYRWSGHDYAFDLEQFLACMRRGRPLLAILTKVDLVPSISLLLSTIGIPVTPVFLRASVASCQRRTLYRNLPATEISTRLRAIEDEDRQTQARSTFISEYSFIENGDDRPFASAVEAFLGLIRVRLQQSAVATSLASEEGGDHDE